MKTTFRFFILFTISLGSSLSYAQGWFQKVYSHQNLHQRPYSISMHPQAGSSVPFIAGSSGTSQGKNAQSLMIMQTDFNGNLVYSESFGTTTRRQVGQTTILNNDTLVIGGIEGPSGSNRGISWRFNTSSLTMIDHTRYTSSSGPAQFRSITNNGVNNVFSGPTQANSGSVFRGFSLLEANRNNPLTIANSVATYDVASQSRLLSARDVHYQASLKTYHQVGYQQGQQAWYAFYDSTMTPVTLALYSNSECSRLTFVGIESINTSEFVILAKGISCNSGYGGNDIIVMIVDVVGNILNQRIYGGSNDEDPRAVRVASNGQIVISGSTNSYSAGGDHDIFMLNLNPDLTLGYFKTFETNAFDDLMLGSNTAMELAFSVTGHEHAFIAGYLDNNDSGLWETELIKSPVNMNSSESCVAYYAIENEESEVLRIAKTPGSTNWGSTTAISQNLVNLDLVENYLCAAFNNKMGLSTNDEENAGYGFSLYPNPVQNELNIGFDAPVENSLTVQIYEISGRLLLEESIAVGASSHQINTSTLNGGSYLLQIRHENGKIENHQFIKP